MRKSRITLFCVALVMAHCCVADPLPENLSVVKKELKQYHDDGAYEQGIANVIQPAKKYLEKRLRPVPQQDRTKIAIVYDIDETALSNYPHMLANDFSGSWVYVAKALVLADAPPILETLDLYHYAKTQGVSQFFITGRPEDLRSATIKNLTQAGYQHWQGLYLLPKGAHPASVADFKASIRKMLEAQGYDVVLSLGDQCSDLEAAHDLPAPTQWIPLPKACGTLEGDYEDAAVKLPNPYYFLP